MVNPTGVITSVVSSLNAIPNLKFPSEIAVDSTGNVYFADGENSLIREWGTGGNLTTVAGSGVTGFLGDGGPATLAKLNNPWGVAVDSSGNIYISDTYNNRIRKVDLSGAITTVAGNGIQGYLGDGGPALSAELSWPNDIALDSQGNLYIADSGNERIRMMNTSGTITTIAGTGVAGYTGEEVAATTAELNDPWGVTVDPAGNLYIADTYNNVLRKVFH